jgi:glycosyl transferase family 11
MVTVLLRGGLGNQMFQFAAGLGLAKKRGTALRLDTVLVKDRLRRRKRTFRDYCLDIFAVDQFAHLTGLSRVARDVPVPGFWSAVDCLAIAARGAVGLQEVVRGKSDRFDPAILEKRRDLLLFDYWMSEKYFADVEEDIRKAFQFKCPLEGEAKEIARDIQSSNSLFLHVRRGDYVSIPEVENTMGKTDLSYYERAVLYVKERSITEGLATPRVFVFSDDIEWCKQNLPVSLPAVYLGNSSAGPKASYHLQLMSLCRNSIIANSTFSWWGAWLIENPRKIVIAPKRWFAHKDTPDVVPQRWVTM